MCLWKSEYDLPKKASILSSAYFDMFTVFEKRDFTLCGILYTENWENLKIKN